MTTGLIGVDETITVSFIWFDEDGNPLTSLSPAPTLTVTAPDGTETAPALTQRGSTPYFDYSFTPDEVGLWALIAECTDTDCATPFTDPVAVYVTETSLTDLQSLVTGLGASATIVSPVREVGGEYRLDLKQGQTHSTAAGTAIIMTFTGLPDTTGGAAVLRLTDLNGKILSSVTGNPFTGSLGSWSGGEVTVTWQLTAAQAATLPASQNNKTDLTRQGRFEVTITDSSGNVLKPIMPTTGDMFTYAQAYS